MELLYRNIKYIVIHCSATPVNRSLSIEALRQYHRSIGYTDIGYHFYIDRKGHLFRGRGLDRAGAHVRGYNSCSIGVCYEGGLTVGGQASDTRTDAQKLSLLRLLQELKTYCPVAEIVGHRDLSPDRNRDGLITPDEWIKACPCFDAAFEYRHVKGKEGRR